MIKTIRGLHMKYSSLKTNAILVFLVFGHMACGISVPDQEAECFNHWTTTEVLRKATLLEDDFNFSHKFYFVLVYS